MGYISPKINPSWQIFIMSHKLISFSETFNVSFIGFATVRSMYLTFDRIFILLRKEIVSRVESFLTSSARTFVGPLMSSKHNISIAPMTFLENTVLIFSYSAKLGRLKDVDVTNSYH